jgi:3-hydroxyisobutyrate dehydrogenase-like beta-hydroxyacid dehydrogenase
VFFLDAPVSGGTAGAQAGTLTIMVGGPEEAFQRVLPVFQAMGKNIRRVGPNGAGSTIKLVNQLLVAINMAGVVEGIVMGVKAGADPQVMLEVLSTSFGGSAMLSRSVPLFLERRFQPGTSINLILKDLGLVDELSQELSLRLLMGSQAEQVFREARALGLGDLDMAALVQPLERLAQVTVGPASSQPSA